MCLFIDLEEAYDRMPRDNLWYCMKKSGSKTVVRCMIAMTDGFKVGVGFN